MEPPYTNEADPMTVVESSIDRREAMAGIGLLGVLGLVLIASVAYRVVDASRPGQPAAERQLEAGPRLALAAPSDASSPDWSPNEDPFSVTGHDAQALEAPAANADIWPNLSEEPTTPRDAEARFDEAVLGAEHIESESSDGRPRFIAPRYRTPRSAGPR